MAWILSGLPETAMVMELEATSMILPRKTLTRLIRSVLRSSGASTMIRPSSIRSVSASLTRLTWTRLVTRLRRAMTFSTD